MQQQSPTQLLSLADNTARILTLYVLHFPTLYLISNALLAERRTSTALDIISAFLSKEM
jgi:hypothetical protein